MLLHFMGTPCYRDMDIRIAISKNDASKIVEALKEFGFNIPELQEKIFLEKEKNIRMGNLLKVWISYISCQATAPVDNFLEKNQNESLQQTVATGALSTIFFQRGRCA